MDSSLEVTILCGCGCKESIPARSWGRARKFALGHNSRMGTRLGKGGANVPRATVSPTTRDFEWAAGFLEGEGCFKSNRGSGEVEAPQKYPEPLYRLQSLFGGSVKERSGLRDGALCEYKTWFITGHRARGVMMTLYGLLSKRRQFQIRNALGIIE